MNKKEKLALSLNIALVLLEVYGFIMCFRNGFDIGIFAYFTVLSNTLCLISSTLYVVSLLSKKSQFAISTLIMYLRYITTCCLALTFIIVLIIIVPAFSDTYGGLVNSFVNSLFVNELLPFHFLCPVVSYLSFVFYEGDRRLNKKVTITYALVPTIVYGCVLVALNALNYYSGPYPFFLVHEYAIYVLVIMYVIMIVCIYFLYRFTLLFNQMHASRHQKLH